jgi:hypothetical protein
MNTIDEITKDFCESFSTKEECTGFMARMIALFELPHGVDPNNSQVQQIVKWCKENLN